MNKTKALRNAGLILFLLGLLYVSSTWIQILLDDVVMNGGFSILFILALFISTTMLVIFAFDRSRIYLWTISLMLVTLIRWTAHIGSVFINLGFIGFLIWFTWYWLTWLKDETSND